MYFLEYVLYVLVCIGVYWCVLKVPICNIGMYLLILECIQTVRDVPIPKAENLPLSE